MGNRIRIFSFKLNLIVALMITLSAAEPCNIHADVCEYKFIVAYQLTMMKGKEQVKAVDGELYPKFGNINKADRIPVEDVITMDGYPEPRLVIAVNGKIPGPAIEAYIGQTVVVTVENQLFSAGITIHWHGLWQIKTPFMDGVPFATQCPIGPSQSFRYRFNLTQTGTYWYHSHSGTQRAMGLYGAFIIREREPMRMQEHVMVVADYNNQCDSNSKYIEMMQNGFISKYQSGLVNGRGRFNNEIGIPNEAPLAKFTVRQGNLYRFRVISASPLYLFEVSVDDHRMTIVSSDGNELEPVDVDGFVINPGERYDFIILADQRIGNYWIRGLYMENNANFRAILHYEGAGNAVPRSRYNYKSGRQILNCGSADSNRLCAPLIEMNSMFDYEVPPIVPGKWKEHFLNFGFPGTPGNTPASINGRVYQAPSVNPLYQPNEVDRLCDKDNCGSDRLCTCTHSLKMNKDDTVQLILLNLGNGSVVNHPIHIHGHTFSVLKMVYPSIDRTGKIIPTGDIDCRGDPKLNYCNDATWSDPKWGGDNIPGIKLKRAPLKDTIIVPAGGYTVIRIKANNPGLWFMHCHIVTHSLNGMTMMLNESFADVVKAPDHFPVCRSFIPEGNSRIPIVSKTAMIVPSISEGTDNLLVIMAFGVIVAVICVLALVIIVLIISMVWMAHRQNTGTMRPSNDSIELHQGVNGPRSGE